MYPKLKKWFLSTDKALPLEDLKSFSIDDKPETVDLIQENNLDRFEKKRNKQRNKGNFQQNNNNKAPKNSAENQQNTAEKRNPEQKDQKKPFKHKKKFPPKRKNNE
mgnify:CR=1 FL=1